jgi:simple sugar transport system permease protein
MAEIFLSQKMSIDFLSTGVRLSIPLVYAALGGVLCERCGVFNIALEGIILAGAFGAAVGAFFLNAPAGGLLGGMLCGLIAGFLLAALSISLRVNQIVSGIAINLLIVGLTAFLSRVVFHGHASTLHLPGFKVFPIPLLSSIPIMGPVLFAQDMLVYLMYVLVALFYLLIFFTKWGLHIRAVGENPAAADTAGISVTLVRYLCVMAGGALASLAGCYLVLSQVFLFSEHMSAGKGFIALAAIALGRWNPVGALLACLLFGLCDALQLRLQFANPNVPYQIFVVLPYIASILALIGVIGRVTPPGSVGIPYKRGASREQTII